MANDQFESYYTEKLWEMVPAFYREEDAEGESPGALRALVVLLAQQAATLRRSNDSLWDDAFIDLCGFTSLTDEHGVGAAVAALSTFRAVVRERAGWRGVRVAKWLGDGAMLVATEPRPLLDAVLRMEQALDLRGCALPLRGGVAAGRVILFEGDDYIGRPVNLAARLVGVAQPWAIAVSDSVRRLADGDASLSFDDLGHHALKGFGDQVPVHLVKRAAAGR